MQEKIKRRIRIAFQISGFLLLVFLIVLSSIGPKKPVIQNPPNIFTPIIAFELVETKEEIANILGSRNEKPGKEIREDFHASINLDFIFLVIYGLFQFFLAFQLYKHELMSKISFFLLIGLIILASASDFYENLSLLKLLQFSVDQYELVIPALKFFTMIKWQALGLASLIFTLVFYMAQIRIASIVFGLTFLCAVTGLIVRPFIEAQTFIMGFAWAISWYKSLPLKKPWMIFAD